MRDAMSAGMSPQEELKQAQKNLKDAQARVLAEETIKRRNKKFLAASKQNQRVLIAQDVIDQLAVQRYVAESAYLRFSPTDDDVSKSDLYDCQLQEVRDQVTCEVCGIGSLMVSACSFVNKLTVAKADEMGWKGVHKYLGAWFDTAQLNLIELWFEDRSGGMVRDGLRGEEYEVPEQHPISRVQNAQRRLRMIMENIVSNRGTFDPTKGKHGRKAVKL